MRVSALFMSKRRGRINRLMNIYVKIRRHLRKDIIIIALFFSWSAMGSVNYDCVYNYKFATVDNTGGPVIFVAPKGGSAEVSVGPMRLTPVNITQNFPSTGQDISTMANDILSRLWLMTMTNFFFESRPGGLAQGLQKLSADTGPDYTSFPKYLSSGNLLVNDNCVSSSGNKNCVTVTNWYPSDIGGSTSRITFPAIQTLYLRPVADLQMQDTWSMKYISAVVPDSEYKDHVVRFDIQGSAVTSEIRNCQGGATNCYGIITFPFSGNIGSMTCTRQATPLALTLTPAVIDFGTVVSGSEILSRELTWTVSGGGQAGRMTLELSSPSGTDDVVMLGSAKIRIFDSNGNRISLGTEIDISGITGVFTVSMEPLPGIVGSQSTTLNITVAAN